MFDADNDKPIHYVYYQHPVWFPISLNLFIKPENDSLDNKQKYFKIRISFVFHLKFSYYKIVYNNVSTNSFIIFAYTCRDHPT